MLRMSNENSDLINRVVNSSPLLPVPSKDVCTIVAENSEKFDNMSTIPDCNVTAGNIKKLDNKPSIPDCNVTSGNSEILDNETPAVPQRVLPMRSVKKELIQNLAKNISKTPNTVPTVFELYTQNTLKHFKPSKLETIYEEPIATKSNLKLVDGRKKRRRLLCSDGINVSKSVIKSRKKRIKQIFGKKFKSTKMPLNEFMERLNSSIAEQEKEFVVK